MDVAIEIDEILLSGMPLSPTDLATLESSLAAELRTRCSTWERWPGSRSVDELSAAPLLWNGADDPVRLGQALAGSVFESIAGNQGERTDLPATNSATRQGD